MSSSDDLDLIDEIIEKDLSTSNLSQTTPQPIFEVHSDEERDQILKLKQVFQNAGNASTQPIPNDTSVPKSEDLLNPRDNTLFDVEPIPTPIPMSMAYTSVHLGCEHLRMDILQTTDQPITNSLKSLYITEGETVMDTTLVEPFNIDRSTHLSSGPPITSLPRRRYDSSGAYNSDNTAVFMPYTGHITGRSQPMINYGSNRGGHTSQPSMRRHSSVIPLPAFDSSFRLSTSYVGLNPLSEITHYYSSEPVLYDKFRDQPSRRGRPYSSHRIRRPKTPRDKEDELNKEEQQLWKIKYELQSRVGSLWSEIQRLKNQKRVESFHHIQFDPEQKDEGRASKDRGEPN